MNKKLLLVEDEPIIALAEKKMLERYGYNVQVAENKTQALEYFKDVDLILMDINLGENEPSGADIAKEILNTREVPIVFLSSHTDKETIQQVKKITNYGYVVKNSGEFILMEAIEMAFNIFNHKTQEINNLNSFFYNSISIMLIVDPSDGSIYEANNAAINFYGYTADEIRSMNISDINILSKEEIRQEMYLAESELRNYFIFSHKLKSGQIVQVEVYSNPIRLYGKEYLFSIIHSIEDKKELLEKYDRFVSAIREGVAIYEVVADGEDFIFDDINNAIVQMGGSGVKCKNDLLGRSLGEVYPNVNEDNFPLIKTLRNVYKTGVPEIMEPMFYKDESTEIWVKIKIYKLNENKVAAIYEDVTLSKEYQDKMQDSEENIRITLDSIGDGVITVNGEKSITRINPVAEKLLGVKKENCIGLSIDQIFNITHNGEKIENPVDLALKTGRIQYLQSGVELISQTGDVYRIADSAAPIIKNGDIIGAVLVFRDVTQEYNQTQEIKKNEKYLTQLLKEINHRIKNNLLIVKSFINLKSANLGIDLSDLSAQVDSVAELHKYMYEKENFEGINLKEYINSLLDNVFNLSSYSVNIINEIDESISFDSKRTVNLGLIIGELATNAIKHGFDQERCLAKKCSCDFKVLLYDKDDHYHLEVENSGKEFKGSLQEKRSSLGLQIVSELVRDINGELSLEKEPNTKFIIDFKLP